ncbi:hypothetical protein DFH29DRAFT_1037659 [Suillus ampliporus]|nr:hypothetical protein DFH29DRAFT_1037659 [Suillus ampliporus]
MASRQASPLLFASELVIKVVRVTAREVEAAIVVGRFKDIEQDIELRKEGILKRLPGCTFQKEGINRYTRDGETHAAGCTENRNATGKNLETILLSLIYPETSLVKLGRAHCKVAALQETLHHLLPELHSRHEHQRKKLESRELSYDAAITKSDKIKSSKKEKEKEKSSKLADKDIAKKLLKMKHFDHDDTSGAPETPKADKSGKEMNITGGALSAMSSMTGRGKKDR